MTDEVRRKADPFAAGNAARRADAVARLIIDKQVERRDGAQRIAESFREFMAALAAGSPGTNDDAALMTFALGVGLESALACLKKKGPVMVRYLDGEALVTMLMPDGPPKGLGG